MLIASKISRSIYLKSPHYSVLNQEVIDNLNIKESGIYVDATIGYAGHSSKILGKCKKGYLYAFDEDIKAVNYSENILQKISDNFEIIKDNFVNMKEDLDQRGTTKVDGIVFDLGFSSPQIDDETRGFSFMKDGNLDMRMNEEDSISAKDIVNGYSYEKLCDIFYNYGEEKMSSKIASKIVELRKNKEIDTTLELVEIIKQSTGANYFFKNHPERQIFQALRIETNHELEVLEKVLPDAIDLLNKGGRLCVITFHSLEDRIVKNIFRKYSEVDDMVKGMPNIPEEYQAKIKLINKKPILPSNMEIDENTRSHSAKLRIVERI